MYLVAGLGNPGDRYRDTRHNVGFRVIGHWCREEGVALRRRRFRAKIARLQMEKETVVLLCPMTYMNLSGLAVGEAVRFFEPPLEQVLVVHDDLDLPLGRLKMVRAGGAGGHKGVRSIIQHLGDDRFPRLKLGIGRPRHDESIESFVLRPFCADERNVIEEVIRAAVRACRIYVSKGMEAAMNYANCRNLVNKEEES